MIEMIKVADVSKTYGSIRALRNVSFSVNEGDVVGYVGPNGSGKTTTIKTITGLCRPDSGVVRILNENALKDYVKIGKRVAVVFENSAVYPYLTAWENLEFYARLVDMPPRVRQGRIQECLEMLGLSDRKKSLAKTFSKGMLRKLAIGRALLTEPQILILDEPFDGIDVSSRLSIRDVLKTWIGAEQHCMLLSSHNMYEVEDLCTTIVILKQGEIIALGSMESLQQTHAQCLIEVTLKERYGDTLIQEALSRSGAEHSFTLNGNRLLVTIDGQDVSSVSSLLLHNGIRFDAISEKRENLNEIYLRKVGHHE